VALFRRGGKDLASQEPDEPSAADPSADEVDTPGVLVDENDQVDAQGDAEAADVRRHGPWDRSEIDQPDGLLDLGALLLPVAPGAKVHLETTGQPAVVTLVRLELDDSELQLAPFAAPRTEGIWDEIRAEIAEQVSNDGGTVDDLPGPFGRELLARVVVRTPEGRTGNRVVRFVGVDGPRWFLRGVMTGKAAVDPQAAAAVDDFFAGTVVVRGGTAMPPRELLAMHLPGQSGVAPADPAAFDPFARGPEITEIR
jgi:hypothetical protein